MPAADATLPRFPADFQKILHAHLPEGVAAPSQRAVARMELHARLLLRWGRVTSLTSISDPAEIVRRHFCESLACLPWLRPGDSLLDLGTGAGFPGLPVQMARDECGPLVLVEPTGRKAEFLRAVVTHTELERVTVVQKHVKNEKELAALTHGFPVDVLLARAIPTPVEWALRTARVVNSRGRGVFFLGDEARAAVVSRLADNGLSLVAALLLAGSRGSWLLVVERAS